MTSQALNVLLVVASVAFALNMGGANLATAFSGILGARILSKRAVLLLYSFFVTLGALWLGKFVASTLGSAIVPASAFNTATTLSVVASAAVSLMACNLLHIPQSTSMITVFAIATVGVRNGGLNVDTLLYRLLPAWVGLPLLAFLLTWGIARLFYPLRGWNFRVYEHLSKHEWKLRALAIVGSCYLSLAVGANNVANVVGPLATSGAVDPFVGFICMAPVFGLGGWLFGGAATTQSTGIVPIGLFSATIGNVVVATLVLVVSWLGIPMPAVHVSALSVVALSRAKEGSVHMMPRALLIKMVVVWFTSPLVAFGATWGLLELLE